MECSQEDYLWERWDWAGEKLNWDAIATEASADPTESS